MVRQKTADGSETVCARFSVSEAAEIDAERGTASRPVWLRQVALAALRAARLPETAIPPVKQARAADGRRRCPHPGFRSIGGYCKDCDHVIEPGGLWRN